MNKSTLAIILGGGQGSRLAPLTENRSKPAVPIAGKYRLVDIPISNCIKDNEKSCLTTESVSAFTKIERDKIVPGNIKQGITIAGVLGTLTSQGPANCAADGEIACVSTSTFVAAATNGLAAKVLAGQTVGAVLGNVTLPASSTVRTNTNYGASNTITGSLGNCASDGGTNCVAVTGFRSANEGGLASKVLSGQTVAGIAGNVTLPIASTVRSSMTFGPNGAVSGTLRENPHLQMRPLKFFAPIRIRKPVAWIHVRLTAPAYTCVASSAVYDSQRLHLPWSITRPGSRPCCGVQVRLERKA